MADAAAHASADLQGGGGDAAAAAAAMMKLRGRVSNIVALAYLCRAEQAPVEGALLYGDALLADWHLGFMHVIALTEDIHDPLFIKDAVARPSATRSPPSRRSPTPHRQRLPHPSLRGCLLHLHWPAVWISVDVDAADPTVATTAAAVGIPNVLWLVVSYRHMTAPAGLLFIVRSYQWPPLCWISSTHCADTSVRTSLGCGRSR